VLRLDAGEFLVQSAPESPLHVPNGSGAHASPVTPES